MIGCAQAVPLYPAANGAVTPALSYEPTAAQIVFPETTTQDTPVHRLPAPDPVLADTTQLVPLKCSANSCVLLSFWYDPTASQLIADTQDTAASRVAVAPGTFALVLIDHAVPFQCSASVLVTKFAVY
jgi:hypothetical protein